MYSSASREKGNRFLFILPAVLPFCRTCSVAAAQGHETGGFPSGRWPGDEKIKRHSCSSLRIQSNRVFFSFGFILVHALRKFPECFFKHILSLEAPFSAVRPGQLWPKEFRRGISLGFFADYRCGQVGEEESNSTGGWCRAFQESKGGHWRFPKVGHFRIQEPVKFPSSKRKGRDPRNTKESRYLSQKTPGKGFYRGGAIQSRYWTNFIVGQVNNPRKWFFHFKPSSRKRCFHPGGN